MSSWIQRIALFVGAVAVLESCGDSNGPRTGTLSLTISGLPVNAPAQVTLSGPNKFSRVLAATEVVAGLRPGAYHISAAPIRDGATRYSPVADTQTVTIGTSDVPVEASVDYAVSSAVLIVTVDGAPASKPADIRVVGPNGFSQSVTASGIPPTGVPITARSQAIASRRELGSPSRREG